MVTDNGSENAEEHETFNVHNYFFLRFKMLRAISITQS
jgi:hypothetical protein